MFFDEVFGPWSRIILVGICVGTIIIILIVTVCFIVPGCLGYKCLQRQKNRKDNTVTAERQTEQQNGNIKLGDVSYRSWRLGSLYDNGSICENGESPRNSYGSHFTAFDPRRTSTMNLVDMEKPKSIKKIKEFPTELTISLQFLPNIDEPRSIQGKLVIGIEALSGLPPKQYNCTIEPYVVVEIIKQSWSQRKREVLHSFRTRGIRHTASPIYRETFVIADVNSYETKEWVLDIRAHDHDRYANHTELCFLRIPLKDVRNIFSSPEIHLFNYKMKQSHQEFGNILLGISYLPTAQRLTITVMKLRDLKYQPPINSSTAFNPYVRVLMLHGKTGRKIKKKKTTVLKSATNLEFNETLTFELSYNQLDNIQFLVVVCNKAAFEIPTIDHLSDSEDSVNYRNKARDMFLGKVALGKGVRGSTERLHWFSVLQNPRKLVTVWHTLK